MRRRLDPHRIGEKLVSLAPGWSKSSLEHRNGADEPTSSQPVLPIMPVQDLETASYDDGSVSPKQQKSRGGEMSPAKVHRTPLQVVFQSSEVFVLLPQRHASGMTTPATATSSGANTVGSPSSRQRQQPQQQHQPHHQQLQAQLQDTAALRSWRPCELTLTEDAVQIASKAYGGVSHVPDGGLCQLSGADELLPCWIELQQIVDVAVSVCVFGSVVKELDAIATDPEGREMLSSTDNETLRATESNFANILRTMPREELHSMLVEIAPYEYKEMSAKPLSTGTLDSPRDESNGFDCSKPLLGSPTGAKDVIVEDEEEWLSNGVALGTFELPPIPLARLPETRSGLPKVTNHPGMQGALPPKAFPGTFGGMPVGEYDSSNCRPHQHMETSIPPLPPGACRLPQRTHRDLSKRIMCTADLLESNETPFAHYLVMWTSASTHLARSSGKTRRLTQGDPVLICFRKQEEAQVAYNILLEYRARQTKA